MSDCDFCLESVADHSPAELASCLIDLKLDDSRPTCPHCCCTYTTECCYCDGSRTPLENQ